MLNDHEIDRLIDLICATAEVMGGEIKPVTAAIMAEDLSAYPLPALERALTRCRRELSGRLTMKSVMDMLAPGGGWLSANEAWAAALPAIYEENTVIWTEECRRSWFVALPIMEAGDKVGARMAFIAAYEREVSQAKSAGEMPKVIVSPGSNAALRDQALNEARATGLLPAPKKDDMLALPTPEKKAEWAENRNRMGQLMAELSRTFLQNKK